MNHAILYLGLVGVGLIAMTGRSNAQAIIPDASLNTIVTPSGSNAIVTGGTAAGTNLFHSFREFSIPTGGSAIFNNAPTVQNIFSRVTGANVSNIDGIIRANGTANLFLLNPNGILFGSNARLNIGGSFVGATATSIQFDNHAVFNTTETPLPIPLLTLSAPIGLQIGSGAIAVKGIGHTITSQNPFAPLTPGQRPTPGLSVTGKTLALVGGAINLNGGVISAPQGRIELGAVAAGSSVQLSQTPQGITLNYAEGTGFQDISLKARSLVDVSGMGGGAVQVQARQVRLTDGSLILSQNRGFQPAGSIRVDASAALELVGTTPDGNVGSSIHSSALSIGKSADVSVSTQRLLVQDGGFVISRTYTPAAAGEVNISAAQTFQILGASAINPSTLSFVGSITYGSGAAGQVNVSTGQLTLRNGGYLARSNFGSSSIGNLVVNADLIEITGVSPILLRAAAISSGAFRSGSAGNITINTRRLTVLGGGRVDTSTLAGGNAGNLTLNVTDSIDVQGKTTVGDRASFIGSEAVPYEPAIQRLLGIPPLPSGSAGTVTINTPRLSVTDGARVTVQNQGTGNGGMLQINTENLVLSDRGSITAATAAGEGGNIFLNASQLLLMRQGSVISAIAGGTGSGGNIAINSPIVAGLENSDIIASAVQGRGGNIQITTQGIVGLQYRDRLTPESDITASSEFGINGTVRISKLGVDPNAGLVELPVSLVDASQQIAADCASTRDSRFVITGRGGIPQNPQEQVSLDRPWADLRRLPSEPTAKVAKMSLQPQPLIEATSWQRNPQTGKVELVAARSAQSNPAATCAINSP